MTHTFLAVLWLATSAPAAPPPGFVVRPERPDGIAGSKHDLSARGPGTIRATGDESPCLFCHLPHRAATTKGLSGRPNSEAKHVPYESSTLAARLGAPTGATRICLSCHDGTIAVGKTVSRTIKTNVAKIPKESRSNLGTDLRGTHPISFRPAPDSRTRTPAMRDPVHLDPEGEVQCTSCHDPHREYVDPDIGKFLAKTTRRSQLCITCHDPGAVAAAGSSHARSGAQFGPGEGNEFGFKSVAEAGCVACHVSHAAEPNSRLVRRPPADDDAACLRCHAAAVTRVQLAADLAKPYNHGGQGRGVHDGGETRRGASRPVPETSSAAPRHAACVDCHNPHAAAPRGVAATTLAGGATLAAGPLAGVAGVDQNGQRVEVAQYEYEICFKCHADSANKPQLLGASDRVRRARPDVNLRSVFSPASPSYHPVVAPGRNHDVPSLKPGWTPSSLVACGDCHGSDTGPGNGGTGPRGPHGSTFAHLLERSYVTADFTSESESAYALCYKCHDRAKLLSETLDAFRRLPTSTRPSTVSLHALHVRDQRAPCSSCHAAHGISADAGTPSENAHLVSFDLSIVQPAPGGPAAYRTAGPRTGSCNLSCHGVVHAASTHAY